MPDHREAGSISDQLAKFVCSCGWNDIPAVVKHEAKRALLNYFGCALGGAQDIAVRGAIEVLSEFSGLPQSTVIGHPTLHDALTATFVNGVSGNVLDFDDTHVPTVMHPAAPIAPALFAFGECGHAPGWRAMEGFVLGIEIACRIGNAVAAGGHYRRGWHITATCGVFGSAVGVARMMNLPQDRLASALAAAAGQSAGIVENLGTMAKCISVGAAARGGYLAALFARRGFTGPSRSLEGEHGFLHVTATEPSLAPLGSGLGQTWELSNNTYKPYPTGVVLNPVIDACLDLRSDNELDPREIDSVHIRANPLLFERTDRPDVALGRESVISYQHTVAVAFLDGRVELGQFTDERVTDPAVVAFRRCVQGTADTSVPIGVAHITVRLSGGRVLTAFVSKASGSLEKPLTDSQLEEKFRTLANYGSPWCDASPLIDAIWTLDQLSDLSTLMALTRPKPTDCRQTARYF